MLCSEASLVNHGEGRVRAATLKCRAWTCELCVEMRRRQLVAEACSGLPDKLLTLTTRAIDGGDAVAEARRQGEAFKLLIKRIRARWPGQEVQYFVVREATKQGWPHLHVLLRAPFLPWSWLVEQWEELSGSPGVDIRKIWRPHQAAKYVAKYIGKNPHQFGTCKRYWSSKEWQAPVPVKEPDYRIWDRKWHIKDVRLGDLLNTYHWKGWAWKTDASMEFFEAWQPP